MIELARAIAAGGTLRRVVHVSTAYVSGRHAGDFGEGDLDLGQKFRNTYERSKNEAELLLREANDLPLAIARPSIVVGHSVSGWTSAFNVLYWPMRAFERGLLQEVPARADSIVDFVPVDYVTDGILALLDDEQACGTYNLVAGERALSAGELVALHSAISGRPAVRFAPLETAGGLPAGRRRSRRTSTCAAASATSAPRRCSSGWACADQSRGTTWSGCSATRGARDGASGRSRGKLRSVWTPRRTRLVALRLSGRVVSIRSLAGVSGRPFGHRSKDSSVARGTVAHEDRPTLLRWPTGLPLPPAFGSAVSRQGHGTIARGPGYLSVFLTAVICAPSR